MSSPAFDVLIFPTIYSYVPVFSRAKKVVFVHDIIADKYPQFTLPSPAARLFWRLKTAAGRRQADVIVTVSPYSRAALADHFKIPLERIDVVGEASDPVFRVLDEPRLPSRLASLGLDTAGRRIIYVGGFGPHKNLGILLDAFSALTRCGEFGDVRLVMVGEYQNEVFYSGIAGLRKQIADTHLEDRVVFTGYVTDEELVHLLNLSTVLVLPSLMEGFGLTAVEAAACGCPVIATKCSPLPEILRDGALYIDPLKPEELEAVLSRVLAGPDLRKSLRVAGLQAARRLSWHAAAEQLLDVVQKVANS